MPGLTSSTATNTSSGLSTSNTAGSGGSSSTATFSPELNDLMGQLVDFSTKQFQNPTAGQAPIRDAGLDKINQAYSTVPQQVTQQLASRGYGSSGKMGGSLYKVGLAKAGAQSDLEGQLADRALQQQNTGASLAEQLLGIGRGTASTYDTSGFSSTNSNNSSNGTATPSILSSIEGVLQLLMG